MNAQTLKALLPAEPRRAGLRQAVVRVIDAAVHLRQAATERRQLLALNDRDLQDIGISRVDALREAEKPLWRGVFVVGRPWRGGSP